MKINRNYLIYLIIKVASILIMCLFIINISYSLDTNYTINNKDKIINEKLDSLEQKNNILQSRIENVDKRIDDIYKCLQIIIILLVVLVGGNYLSSYYVVKKQASEELDKLKPDIAELKSQIIKLTTDAQSTSNLFEELKTQITDVTKFEDGEKHE